MMNDMSLKAKIRNLAKEMNVPAQAVLQNYLMNRFMYRLSLTEYKEKFVIKGGMLISSIVGIGHRSTMDIDTTVKNLPLTEESIQNAFETICAIKLDDGIMFSFDSISPIRDDDQYGGYRVGFNAVFGKINAPMSMDVSTGDIITPGAMKYLFSDILEERQQFELWAYPIETVLAEKIETILSRGIDNTRPRDFYDVYMLSSLNYEKGTFKKAYMATAKHRESYDKLVNPKDIIKEIAESPEMNRRWENYAKQMPYANEIAFSDTLNAIFDLVEKL